MKKGKLLLTFKCFRSDWARFNISPRNLWKTHLRRHKNEVRVYISMVFDKQEVQGPEHSSPSPPVCHEASQLPRLAVGLILLTAMDPYKFWISSLISIWINIECRFVLRMLVFCLYFYLFGVQDNMLKTMVADKGCLPACGRKQVIKSPCHL